MKTTDDIIWKMLSAELTMERIRDLQAYLRGETEFFEMGYGDLIIEPYDGSGGRSRMFRLRHERFGETTLSHSALGSVLHDLHHYLRKLSSAGSGDGN